MCPYQWRLLYGCKGSWASPKMSKIKWSNIYCCVNASLIKNALERIHLEEEFVKNQLLIAGRLTVASHCVCLLKLSVH